MKKPTSLLSVAAPKPEFVKRILIWSERGGVHLKMYRVYLDLKQPRLYNENSIEMHYFLVTYKSNE